MCFPPRNICIWVQKVIRVPIQRNNNNVLVLQLTWGKVPNYLLWATNWYQIITNIMFLRCHNNSFLLIFYMRKNRGSESPGSLVAESDPISGHELAHLLSGRFSRQMGRETLGNEHYPHVRREIGTWKALLGTPACLPDSCPSWRCSLEVEVKALTGSGGDILG